MHLQRLAMPSRRVPAKISAELAIFAIGAIQARRVDSTPSQTFARGRTIRPISNNTDVQLSRQVPRSRGAFASSFILHPSYSAFILPELHQHKNPRKVCPSRPSRPSTNRGECRERRKPFLMGDLRTRLPSCPCRNWRRKSSDKSSKNGAQVVQFRLFRLPGDGAVSVLRPARLPHGLPRLDVGRTGFSCRTV